MELSLPNSTDVMADALKGIREIRRIKEERIPQRGVCKVLIQEADFEQSLEKGVELPRQEQKARWAEAQNEAGGCAPRGRGGVQAWSTTDGRTAGLVGILAAAGSQTGSGMGELMGSELLLTGLAGSGVPHLSSKMPASASMLSPAH